MGPFEKKVAIVTGGAYGIGRGTAIAFAKEGASVTIADINDEVGHDAVAEINKSVSKGRFIHADVSQASECKKVVSETSETFGGIDILFNNVGIQPLNSYLNVENTSEALWDRILNVNLKSCFLMSKQVIPEIRKRGGGVIINTASVQGLQSQKLVPAYAASKGGILSLTRQMALDYASENIRVVAVNPGIIDTNLVRTVASNEPGDSDELIEKWGQTHPVGRIGTPDDIANIVLFLASDKASLITGEHVNVDGGLMAVGAWSTAAGSRS